jgi:hypothetical protein
LLSEHSSGITIVQPHALAIRSLSICCSEGLFTSQARPASSRERMNQ